MEVTVDMVGSKYKMPFKAKQHKSIPLPHTTSVMCAKD